MIHDSIVDTIGSTPVVRINRLAPEGCEFYVKLEAFNPLASVKDRLAWAIINDAERRGELMPGQTVIEATSGNTGIALAGICAARGYPFVGVMSESFSIERRKLMRMMGARLIITPKEARAKGMLEVAEKLAEKNGWFLARQFQNFANPEYHANTTGPEILRDFAGRSLDYFVTGWGTGGTMSGAGRVLKSARPNLKVIASEPEEAALLKGEEWAPHKIQGWTPDFIPEVLDREIFDELLTVDGDESVYWSRQLAAREGILTGISGGATFATAHNYVEHSGASGSFLIMLPDTGERYLSTVLFEGLAEGSDDDLLE